ncbi:MAG: HD domain-containing protein [Proteobacteria bacterium]|nr:HD domain-containing protein [Pseudomonadota bacterium]
MDTKIIKHSRQVASVAVYLASVINMSEKEKGLVLAAGLFHDLARKEPEHDKAGAAILEELGFSEVAKIVINHMDIKLDENDDKVDTSKAMVEVFIAASHLFVSIFLKSMHQK